MATEENQPTLIQRSSTYGLYLGLMLVLLQLVQYLSDQYISPLFIVLNIGVSIAAVILILRNFKKKNDDRLEFGQGVAVGSFSFLFAGLILGAFMLILIQVIDREYPEKFLMAMEDLYLNAGINEEQLDVMLKEQRQNMNPWTFGLQPIIQFGFGGLVLSLIASLFMRKTGGSSYDKDTL